MRTPHRLRCLPILIAALVCALVVVPGASAAALSTVVEVGTSAGTITPATVTGSTGDTFQIRNAGTTSVQPLDYITVENGTGSMSIGGNACSNSGICWIPDGATETATITAVGTFTIVRHSPAPRERRSSRCRSASPTSAPANGERS